MRMRTRSWPMIAIWARGRGQQQASSRVPAGSVQSVPVMLFCVMAMWHRVAEPNCWRCSKTLGRKVCSHPQPCRAKISRLRAIVPL